MWSESEDCLPFLQLAQDYISSCGKKTLLEVLEKVFTSFRPVRNQTLLNDDRCLLCPLEIQIPQSDNQRRNHCIIICGLAGVNGLKLKASLVCCYLLILPSQLLGLPDLEDDSFEHYHADMEGEPGPDHQQMGVSQQ